jgi:hypothetical protein
LILSSHLASLNIFIKDFFTLDYLKAGLLFIFINLPIFLIAKDLNESKLNTTKKIIYQLLSILGCIMWLFMLSSFLFQNKETNSWTYYSLIIVLYPILAYIFSISINGIKFKKINMNGLDVGVRVMFFLVLLTYFSNTIFPQIKFRFGGGSSYMKTLFIKNEDNSISKINAKIYYENDNWIHFLDKHDLVISMPKSKIIKTESKIESDSILKELK